MLGGTHAQAAFQAVVEIADCDAGHGVFQNNLPALPVDDIA
jgi:hypothetical protein